MLDMDLIGERTEITRPRKRPLTEAEERMLAVIAREEKRLRARENYHDFLEYINPDPQHPDDVTKSSYISKPIHKVMVQYWEEIDRCVSMRSALSVPPQTGKTKHTTIEGSAWSIGRNPNLKIINGTYNESRAKQNGNLIRRVVTSRRYREVFPEMELSKGGKSKSYLETSLGGYVLMVGRGSGVTGQPCDIFNIDDPIKDKAEANSTAALEEAWEWFSTTANQRAHNLTRFAIMHTRWAAMDLIGRICDKDNPDYDEDRARGWTYLNIKAYNNEPHIAGLLGIQPQDYIWPEKFSPELLANIRSIMSEEDFSALYMGKPVPDEGGFFKKTMIQEYLPAQCPKRSEMRIYASSDHAVSTKTHGNHTVLLIAGVDAAGQVWLLDCVRERMETDKTVEHMIRLMKEWRPITWWAARDHISKSFGPFLKRRMRDEGVYATHVSDSPEIGNKMQKAQSIRGMMALGLVRFPRKAHWFQDMVNELLRFRGEGDAQDDFVDAMGHLGRGLEWMMRGHNHTANDVKVPAFKTLAWVQGSTAAKKAEEARIHARAGW
jgi:predicted phage terminase large subunit-like protein